MAVTYVTLYPPGGNTTTVQVVEGSQLHFIYAEMGFSATPSAPGPPKRPDPFPQYVHDDEIGDLLADAAVPATDPVVADLVSNSSSATGVALRAAFAALDGDNVFTAAQRFNGGLGINADPDPKQPIVFTTVLDGPTVRASGSLLDKVLQQQNLVITGDFTGDTGSNPDFLWGENKYLTIGSGALDGKGLANVTTSLIEVNVGSPTGVNFSGAVRALELAAQISGAAAGAHIGTMETLRIGAPKRVNGATGGTVDNAYTLFVEGLDAADVGATSALSVFVSKGVSRFGGRVDVDSVIAATGGALTLQGALGAPAASLSLGDTSPSQGGHAQIKLGASGSVFAVTSSGGSNVLQMDNGGNVNLAGGIGLFGTSAVGSKPTVTGSRGGNAALASLLTALASYGLVTDSTTA